LKKFRGVLQNYQGSDHFLEFLNFVDWVHGLVERTHGLGLPVHATTLNIGRRLGDQRLRLNEIEPVSVLSSGPQIKL
jgi:hypothetical protein